MINQHRFIIRTIDGTNGFKRNIGTVCIVAQLAGYIDLKIAFDSFVRTIFIIGPSFSIQKVS